MLLTGTQPITNLRAFHVFLLVRSRCVAACLFVRQSYVTSSVPLCDVFEVLRKRNLRLPSRHFDVSCTERY